MNDSCVTVESSWPSWRPVELFFGVLVSFESLMKAVDTFPSKMHEHPVTQLCV